MKFDAFTAGIEPGGLRSKDDIKILICYILARIDKPISSEDISNIFQEKSIANYFEVADAMGRLQDKGHIADDENGDLVITDTGRRIAENLDTYLPSTIRNRAVEAAIALLARARLERENKVDIEPMGAGYKVTCHISGGEIELMAISVFVADMKQAEAIKENFYDDPQNIYQLLLSSLTGDKELFLSFFEKKR